MLVAHACLHDIEYFIHGRELNVMMLLEVPADEKLSERVHSPDVPISGVQLYKVGVSEDLVCIFFLIM